MNIQWKAKKSENRDFQVLESVGPWDGSPQQERQHTATHCNTLRHTATHCNTLQHTAIHCNTLRPRKGRGTAGRSKKGALTHCLAQSLFTCVCVCMYKWAALLLLKCGAVGRQSPTLLVRGSLGLLTLTVGVA